MRIVGARAAARFVGGPSAPRQVLRVVVAGQGASSLRVIGVGQPHAPVRFEVDGEVVVELGAATGAVAPGGRIDLLVVLGDGESDVHRCAVELVVAEPGWRMFLVPHFHYDPVWWNTQAFYTETWEKLPPEDRPWEGRRQQPAFTLIDAHLDAARRDPDYRFVLAELDYLKPYWDTFPWRRDELRGLLAGGRLELMGGTYNEPNTNLTSAESTARNAVYGIGYQRDVLGGAPATAWQLDAFGHDPQFPGMMADAGLTSSSWARGPFHQWGPSRSPGGNLAMQFASEFDWVSPSGRGLLTSYMANHYSAGWDLDKAADIEEALDEAERLFTELAVVAATRNVLLPVGSDYTPPNRWATEIQRVWNERYTWPRFEVALPREFFAAVRRELTTGPGASPQTRDMNPIYSGKDVSYIDTKQAQRVGENLLLAAERFATVASLTGARYPSAAVDKAWRQLLYGAHHDGITGTESDQVYLDLLGGWRDTYELAKGALAGALDHIGADIAGDGREGGQRIGVFNAQSWQRRDVVRHELGFDPPVTGVSLSADDGAVVPHVLEAVQRDADDRVIRASLVFVVDEVPSVGYRTYRVVPDGGAPSVWEAVDDGTTIANETYELTVDPRRGGAISRWIDRRDGASLLRPDGLGNEVLAYTEYAQHPQHGEGPWHLTPTGEVESSADAPALDVRRERSAVGERLVIRSAVRGCQLRQTLTLFQGIDRVVCTTDLDGYDEHDVLFRLRVAADVPGGLPISEVGNAVVGRGAGFPDVDVAEVPYTLDNPAYNWFGVGTTARIDLEDVDGDGSVTASRSIAIAEVIGADGGTDTRLLRDLVIDLVRRGVTSTTARGDGPRYGSIDTDSNLPDLRVAVGAPDENSFTRAVLDRAGDAYRNELDRQLATSGRATVYVPGARPLRDVWRPNADLRHVDDLPVLIVAGDDASSTRRAVDEMRTSLAQRAVVRVQQPGALHSGEGRAAVRTVGIINVGMPGFNVDVDGALHLSLMRSCSGWPAGVWLDPPRRTTPDGASFQFQHWTHRFEYALVAGPGDWREAGFVRSGHEHNDPLRARTLPDVVNGGGLPATHSFLEVDGDPLVVTAIKPAGNAMASMAEPELDATHGITIRAYEPHGRAATSRIRLAWPIADAVTSDLLEVPRGSLPVDEAGVHVTLPGAAIATLRVVPDAVAPADGPQLGLIQEPAQPVFGDYWLHNKGAAPIGYQPITARIVQRAVLADGPFDIEVSVASQRTDGVVAGVVELHAPEGWIVDPPRRTYHLAPGAHERFPARVTPRSGAPEGRWFVRVRLPGDDGQVQEDVVTVDLGGPHRGLAGERILHLERATRRAAVVDRSSDAGSTAEIGGELSAQMIDDVVRASEERPGQLRVLLDNHVRDSIRGEAQLISPWGTWDAIAPWTSGFTVEPGTPTTVAFTARCPIGQPPTLSWALVKVMYLGRVHYTATVPVLLGGAA